MILEEKENLHLIFTGNQQFPVDEHDNFGKSEIFNSQFLVTSLLQGVGDLKKF